MTVWSVRGVCYYDISEVLKWFLWAELTVSFSPVILARVLLCPIIPLLFYHSLPSSGASQMLSILTESASWLSLEVWKTTIAHVTFSLISAILLWFLNVQITYRSIILLVIQYFKFVFFPGWYTSIVFLSFVCCGVIVILALFSLHCDERI